MPEDFVRFPASEAIALPTSLSTLRDALTLAMTTARTLKPEDRSEKARTYQVAITDLEKLLAWAIVNDL